MITVDIKKSQAGNKLRQILLLIFRTTSISFLLLLASCASNNTERYAGRNYVNPVKSGIVGGAALGLGIGAFTNSTLFPITGVIGAVMGGAIGQYISAHQGLADRLIAKGIQVIQVGDEFRMILPADYFFYDRTPRFNKSYIPVLKDIAEFLNGFEKIDVEVAGYTDFIGDAAWYDIALSRQQAETLMKYLFVEEINTRLMMAKGYGSCDPIASNSSTKGRSLNRRIEIRWRRWPVL